MNSQPNDELSFMSQLHDVLWYQFYPKSHLCNNLTHEKMSGKNGYSSAVLKKRHRKSLETGNAFKSFQVYQNDKSKLKFGKGKRFKSDEEMHAACAVNMHSRSKAADIHQAVTKTKVFWLIYLCS